MLRNNKYIKKFVIMKHVYSYEPLYNQPPCKGHLYLKDKIQIPNVSVK